MTSCGTVFQQAGETVRACVITRGLVSELVPWHMSKDLTTVRVRFKAADGTTKEMLVASAYLHGLQEVPSRELRALIEDESLQGLDLIVGCDSNAHHYLWGSRDCNERGHRLVEFLDQCNLDVANRGTVPTFVTGRGESVIDVTICSLSVISHIKDWHVPEDVSLSDHRYIKFWLEGRGAEPVYRRHPRKMDWAK